MRPRIGKSRVRFTVKLWKKWLARPKDDAYSQHLREGIQEFRALLVREPRQ